MGDRDRGDSEVSRLKKRIKQLEKDKAKLISEVNTLETALAKNNLVMKERADHFKLEELIEQSKTNKR